jgi:hypothetical protein
LFPVLAIFVHLFLSQGRARVLAYSYEVVKNRKFELICPSQDGRNRRDSSRKIWPERLAAQVPPITL